MLRTVMVSALVTAALTAGAAAAPTTVTGFGDISFWTGSGSKRAALVLEFGGANGDSAVPTAIAWGYRWDGDAFVAEMVLALTGSISGSGLPGVLPGSDPRLGIDALDYGPGLGIGVVGLTYDQAGLPAPGWTQTLRAMVAAEDWSVYPALFLHAPVSPGAQTWPGTAFAASALGISSEPLEADHWYAFAPTTDVPYPPDPRLVSQPAAAVPEASGIMLVACAGAIAAGCLWRRRARRR